MIVTVLIEETLTREVKVEVNTTDTNEAERKALKYVKDKYRNGDIVLNADNYCDSEFIISHFNDKDSKADYIYKN